jgi:hypothetical protein
VIHHEVQKSGYIKVNYPKVSFCVIPEGNRTAKTLAESLVKMDGGGKFIK